MKKASAILPSIALFYLSMAANAEIKMNINGYDSQKTNIVQVSEMDVDVEVAGNIASTRVEMVFVNKSDRVFEGELEFPLGDGESVTGYALDIGAKMRQGVVVEKERGRQVFENVVRQNIDPGLVEMTAGNNFKTRVYPLPAKGRRRVQITYQAELKTQDSGEARLYTFSALCPDVLDTFTLKITVLDNSEKSLSPVSQNDESPLNFSSIKTGRSAVITKKNFKMSSPVSISIPNNKSESVFTQDIGKDTFFYYYNPILSKKRIKPLPKSLAVLYDVSSSMEGRNQEAELALLCSYIEKLDSPTIAVITFSNDIHNAAVFSGNAHDTGAKVAELLQSCQCDGGTNFGIDFAAAVSKLGCAPDETLLFTDGIQNWGDSKHQRLGNAPVTAVNSCASADHALLKQISENSGGVYINMRTLSQTQSLNMLTTEALCITGIEYDNNAICDIYPAAGSAVSDGLFVTGILKRKTANVKVNLGYGGKEEQTLSFNVNVTGGTRCENIARLWAIKKIDALSSNYDSNKDEITRLAKKYCVVTRGTSLIVLESVQDYVKYNITPPDELRAEFDSIVAAKNISKQQEDKGIGREVYSAFERFRQWWLTSPDEFKAKSKKLSTISQSRIENSQSNERILRPLEAAAEDRIMLDTQQQMNSARMEMPMLSASAPDSRDADIKSSTANNNAQSSVKLMAWTPDAEYLSVLKQSEINSMYDVYLELKKRYGDSPAFYMEVSDYFLEEGLAKESLKILSNMAEMNLENSDVLRALGNKLVERGMYEKAATVFEKLTSLRSEIPQFYRDLAMAYKYSGQTQKAVDTLYKIVCKKWDARFSEIQQIALNDMNDIIATSKTSIDTSAIDKKLMENFDMDVRIVLTWNTDDCDVDLWVTDATGEKCYYGNRQTANGGRLSRDFTQGYGPEEFCLHVASGGTLKIEANYFSNHQQKLLQPVVVQAEVYTNFGRKEEKRETLTLQLDSIKQTFFIGDVSMTAQSVKP